MGDRSERTTCAMCGRGFRSWRARAMHEVHAKRQGECARGGNSQDPPASRVSVCHRCGTDFGSSAQLHHHNARRRAGKLVCIDSTRIRAAALEHIRKTSV